MLQTNKMTVVSKCEIGDCAYNSNNDCHTIAITIGDGERPMCDTFFKSPTLGSVKDTAGVGLCKVSECRHNTDFECGASSIQIGNEKNLKKCLTFAMA